MTSGRPPFQGTTSAVPPAPRIRADGGNCDQLGELLAKLFVRRRHGRIVGARRASPLRLVEERIRASRLETVCCIDRDAEVSRPERVAAAAALRPEALDLAERVHCEAAGAPEPTLVPGTCERLQERVAVAGRPVADGRPLLESGRSGAPWELGAGEQKL